MSRRLRRSPSVYSDYETNPYARNRSRSPIRETDPYPRRRERARYESSSPGRYGNGYSRPVDRPRHKDGTWLSRDIDITVPKTQGVSDETARQTSFQELASSLRLDQFHIETATCRAAEDGQHIGFTYRESSSPWDGMQWYHLQTDEVSLDVLARLLRAAPAISAVEKLLAGRLLHDLKTDHVDLLGRSTIPTVMRYNKARKIGDADRRDVTVTFLSTSYFSVRTNATNAQDTTTELFQNMYPGEDTYERDSQQMFSRYVAESKKDRVCVCRIFFLLFDEVLLSISDRPAQDYLHPKLSMKKADAHGSRPRLARIVELLGRRSRVFYVGLAPMPSYLDLSEQIKQHRRDEYDPGVLVLRFSDGFELNAMSWMQRMERETAAVIEITLEQGLSVYPGDDDVRINRRSGRTNEDLRARLDSAVTNALVRRNKTGLEDPVVRRRPRRRDTDFSDAYYDDRVTSRRVQSPVDDERPREREREPIYRRRQSREMSPSRQAIVVGDAVRVFNDPQTRIERVRPRRTFDSNDTHVSMAEQGRNLPPPNNQETALVPEGYWPRFQTHQDERHEVKAMVRPARRQRSPEIVHVDAGSIRDDLIYKDPGTSVLQQRIEIYNFPGLTGDDLGLRGSAKRKESPSAFDGVDDKGNATNRLSGDLTALEKELSEPRTARKKTVDASSVKLPPARFGQVSGFAPFFALGSSSTGAGSSELQESQKFDIILQDLDEQLSARRNWSARKVYVRGPQISLTSFELSHPFILDKALATKRRGMTFTQDITEVMGNLASQLAQSHVCNKDDLSYFLGTMFDEANELVGRFLPIQYPHTVLEKVWGSLNMMFEHIQNSALAPAESGTASPSKLWIIRPPQECDTLAKEHGTVSPFSKDRPTTHQARFVFRSQQEAILYLGEHLHVHPMPTSEVMARYIASYELSKGIELFDHLTNVNKSLFLYRTLVDDIVEGLASPGMETLDEFPVPLSLHSSFRAYILFQTYAARLSNLISSSYQVDASRSEDDIAKRQRMKEDCETTMLDTFNEALDLVSKAKNDVMLISRAQAKLNVVRIDAVDLPMLVTGILANLGSAAFYQGKDLIKTNRVCLQKLEYRASIAPRKKVLRDIQYFIEELEAEGNVMDKLIGQSHYLIPLLSPDSHHVVAATREARFHLEGSHLESINKAAYTVCGELNDMQSRASAIADRVKRSVEILEEDHGKAIVVFTTITTIFLPLSFVAGLFGINTVDIRNLEHGQWLFWAAAVPFTIAVTCITLVFAFKGADLTEHFAYLWAPKRRNTFPLEGNSSGRPSRAQRLLPSILDRNRGARRRKGKRTDTMDSMELGQM